MLNPMISKMVSLMETKLADKGPELFQSQSGGRDFLSTVQTLMSQTRKGLSQRSASSSGESPSPRAGYKGHLETLRKGLTGKGKSLDQLLLNRLIDRMDLQWAPLMP